MSSSYHEFKDRGFWENDGPAGIAAAYLLRYLQELPGKPDWLLEFQELVKDNSKGYFVGWMHFSFDEFLVTEERRRLLSEVLQDVRHQLHEMETMLDIEELNALYTDDEHPLMFKGKVNKRIIIDVLDKFLLLI
ncbi:hypothetical protein [Chitinophaga caseinilytica]|uniref:Uncharacterized protein n=1 Tax=Chitinophaga caseinilytica TaxID=2267521 RepID=A0ABZ2Z1H3_9BACT